MRSSRHAARLHVTGRRPRRRHRIARSLRRALRLCPTPSGRQTPASAVPALCTADRSWNVIFKLHPPVVLPVTSGIRGALQDALAPAYVLERELAGGMSQIFVATETALGRTVVVKVLPPALSVGLSVERFRREIQVAARLQHPHIVPLLSTGQAGEFLYYTMPYVEGESLRARIAARGELPVSMAVRILAEVARALAYAHRQGIAHRDIKPENILLADEEAQVTDFGIAKALSASASPEGLTSAGLALGTPAYMAPEQATGDPAVDHRTDLYALGLVGYEMLAGRQPFQGRSPAQLLAAHATARPTPLRELRPGVPPALGDLVMRLLEKRPVDRPQSADEVLRLLEAVPITATPALTVPVAVSRRRRTLWRLTRGVAALGLVLVLGALADRKPLPAADRSVGGAAASASTAPSGCAGRCRASEAACARSGIQRSIGFSRAVSGHSE